MTSLSTRALRRSVLSAPVRHRMARVALWHPGTVDVRLDKLLLGGQSTLTAHEFAIASGDSLWPSRRVVDGPHADLLERAAGGPLSDADILASRYGSMARTCVRHAGRYFTATDDQGIVEEARAFLDRAAGSADPAEPEVAGDHHSAPGVPVLVSRIAGSECYQVIDGHHRVALRAASGDRTIPVRVRRGQVTTPLQDLLLKMSWIGGNKELYQPIRSPELEGGWATVRRCTDRFASMQQMLRHLEIEPTGSSYLDVASCYGWFVARMDAEGFAAEGLERDPLAPGLGRIVYGLDQDLIRVGDAVTLLGSARRQWDVVSCFSLLHHFVLGRGSCGAEELVRRLDSVTGRVLFLDTGQEHEDWFSTSLRGWDAERVASFLREHTTFDRVIDLGPDQDAVPPYEKNYARHLFACVRS